MTNIGPMELVVLVAAVAALVLIIVAVIVAVFQSGKNRRE